MTRVKDGRQLDRKAQERIRLMACRRVQSGETVTAVMKSYGYSRTTIYKWLSNYQSQGQSGIQRKTGSGAKARVSAKDRGTILRWIDGKDPRDHGYTSALWTRSIVGEMIRERLGIKLARTAVGDLLAKLNITPQKPLRRAYERDEQEVLTWKEKNYPMLLQRAKRLGAEIFFLDEAGIKSDSKLGRTWGVKGKTPIVKTSGQRQQVNAISAVNPMGKFWFAVFDAKLNAEFFIAFLKNFMKYRKKPLIIILDGHPAHTAKTVAQFVQSTLGKLQLFFLPPYAPDLNPDEFVWKHLKDTGIRKVPLRKNESLKKNAIKQLKTIAKSKKTIQSFFKAKSVAYSTG